MSLDKLRKVVEGAGQRNLWAAPNEAHTSVSDHVCLPAPWLRALLDVAEASEAQHFHLNDEWERLLALGADEAAWDEWERHRLLLMERVGLLLISLSEVTP